VRFILRRAGFYLVALVVAIVINFFLPRLLPGDPAATILGSSASSLSVADLERVRSALGLTDDPLPVQFATYVSRLFQGDMGISYSYFPAPVTEVLRTGLVWTVVLGLTGVIISFVVGNLIGIVASWRRGGVADTVVPPFLIFLGSFPAFFLALGLLYVFGLTLGVLPFSHAYDIGLSPSFSITFIGSVVRHLILPVTAVVLLNIGQWALGMRNVMVGVLNDDYVTMAEAKGLRQRQIMFGYATRNALLPGITGLGFALGSVLSGQILIETVFAYPGMGFLLINAVNGRDYPLMQGLFLMLTVSILAANFLVDIAYTWLDPRVRKA